jgi:hypothetical protein
MRYGFGDGIPIPPKTNPFPNGSIRHLAAATTHRTHEDNAKSKSGLRFINFVRQTFHL